ncbi:hypothetical protein F-liban_223 [Faustovirus]|nr:hypothetical protein F-liban_223 [Faustovirus]
MTTSVNCGYVDIRGVPVMTLRRGNEYYLIKALVMTLLGIEPSVSTTRIFPAGTKTIKISDIRAVPYPSLANRNCVFIECNAVINALLTKTGVTKARITELITHNSNLEHIRCTYNLIPLIRITEPEILALECVDAHGIVKSAMLKSTTAISAFAKYHPKASPAPPLQVVVLQKKYPTKPSIWKMSLNYICVKRKREDDINETSGNPKRQKILTLV